MKLPFEIDLSNKTAVVTGGGGILCSGFSKVLAQCGAKVAVLDLRGENASAVADEINKNGGTAMGISANVLGKDSLMSAKAEVNEKFGKVDILINGAGGNSPRCTTAHEIYEEGDIAREDISTFFGLDKEGFDFVFDLNLMGTLLPTQVFAPDMLGREGCCILNVSSMNAFRPLTKIPAYSAAKAAVSNFTQWLAVHFAGQGIRVNAMAPGFFVTNQNRAMLFDPQGNPTPRTEKILRATPMGRFGRPEELIGTLLWLTDPKASGFVTGIVVPVDGGFSAYSGV